MISSTPPPSSFSGSPASPGSPAAPASPTSWLILGAGYTGMHLARRLAARGDRVVATHRAPVPPAEQEPGISTLALELDAPRAEWPELPAAEIAVICAPPGRPAGAREAQLVAALRCRRLIYVSSTGVYGVGRGQWVDEAWPLEPESESGHARAAAEASVTGAADAAGLPWTILRASGIYGPGRSLVARLRRGEVRVVGDGRAHICRIHVADLVSAIVAAAEREVSGAVNCSDDAPTPYGEVVDEVAARLGLPPPPRVDPETATPVARAMLLADRKIANRRLREELGVTLRYPSWRVAVEEELAAEAAATD